MVARSSKIQNINKFGSLNYPGMLHGYYFLPEKIRLNLFAELFDSGIPPTKESIERIRRFKDFQVLLNRKIHSIEEWDNKYPSISILLFTLILNTFIQDDGGGVTCLYSCIRLCLPLTDDFQIMLPN